MEQDEQRIIAASRKVFKVMAEVGKTGDGNMNFDIIYESTAMALVAFMMSYAEQTEGKLAVHKEIFFFCDRLREKALKLIKETNEDLQ